MKEDWALKMILVETLEEGSGTGIAGVVSMSDYRQFIHEVSRSTTKTINLNGEGGGASVNRNKA